MFNLVPHFIINKYQANSTHGSFQAATLSVDISGFTALTETLMQHSKDGAEALTDTLTNIFQPLVSETYKYGGLIPLFAGDAFVALFPCTTTTGSEKEKVETSLRALQVAFTMKRFFAPDGEKRVIQTPYGRFRIGARIGISVGEVQWGIVGENDSYRFYFRGPAVARCNLAQQQTRSGVIAADARIMPFIAPHVTAVAAGEHRELTTCSLKLPPSSLTQPSISGAELAPFVPDAILNSSTTAEFREICPVFISFEAPAAVAQLHNSVRKVLTLAQQYGGYLSQIEFGDKGCLFVVLFGAPVAYENVQKRAAEFLLALKRSKRPARWRAGMTFGTAWTGIRGGVERCEYGAVGDVVNLAARLATKANWGELWVDEAVYEQLSDRYWLGALGVFPLKGKSGQTSIYQLIDRKELTEDAFYTGQMIGREAEKAQLHHYIQPIFAGQSAGIIYVRGEAGIGKSRLVHEFQRELTRHHYLNLFYCPAEEILRTSLNPFKSLLRDYFRQIAQYSNEENRANFDAVFDFLVQQLPENDADARSIKRELVRTRSILAAMVDLQWPGSLYEQLEPMLRFQNMLAAFKNFIKAQSLLRPVLLRIEDAQWLDADSQQMLAKLTRNVNNYPIAVICVSRYLDDGEALQIPVDTDVPQRAIDLGHLNPQGVRNLAEQILQGLVTTEIVEFLVEKTGGNPFFTEQLVLDLNERDLLIQNGDAERQQYALAPIRSQTVPTNINAILVSRLDRLEAEVQKVVRTATVLGQEFNVPVLSNMLRDDGALSAKITTAEQKQIWRAINDLRYAFKHALLRDAAYSMQLRAQLRQLHRLAAEAVEATYGDDLAPYYADLAYHYDKAQAQEKAVRWYRLAGEQAAGRYANDEALSYYNRALELVAAEALEKRFELHQAREKIYALQGAREAQTADLTATEELANTRDDEQKLAEANLSWAHYADAIGDYEMVVERAQTAVNLAHACQAHETEAASHLVWGRAHLRQGAYDEAQAQGEQALALARSAAVLKTEADALRMLGVVAVDRGAFQQARRRYRQALTLYRQIGDRRGESLTLNNLGTVSWEQRDYPEARTYWERALRIHQQVGDREGESMVLNNLGILAMDQGHYDQAQPLNEKVLHICREIGVRLGECYALLNLGLLHHYQNEHEMARDYSRRALAVAQHMGGRRFRGYAFMNLGHALTGLNRLAKAIEAYEQALALWRELEQASLVVEALAGRAHVNLMRNNLTAALEDVEEIVTRVAEDPTLEGTEAPFRIYLTCYRVLLATDDARAPDILATAYRLLQERAALISDETTRQSFLHNVADHRAIIEEFER